MEFQALRFDAPLAVYEAQAEALLAAYRVGDDANAYESFRRHLPLFMDKKIPWLSLEPTDADVRDARLGLAEAQLTIARQYNFRDWTALVEFAEAASRHDSEVFLFESAVEAVVEGDTESLRALLAAHLDLVHARSTRVTNFDPPVHRATLLHYVGANGVEGHRQRTPKNAVEVAKILLTAGAEVDAVADMYGNPCTTMSMLVSSAHPAGAGVQVALTETLLDFGSAIEGPGTDRWGTPLMTALAFGYPDVAEALFRRGARADYLPAVAGLGMLDQARELLPSASGKDRHSALALAAQLGHVEVLRLLLDAGEDPNRFNPEGHHAHSTPLHQAALAGHSNVVRLLVERGARLDIEDTIYKGTPLGWALHAGQTEVAEYLRGLKTS